MAQKVGASEDLADFDRAFTKIVTHRPPSTVSTKSRKTRECD
jgi:hypothetical protein